MRVRFFELEVTDDRYRKELLDSVDRVLQHGMLILGPEVEEFEKRVAAAAGTRYAIGVASGSSAVYLALKSAGIGPGDEVITTPLTWILTFNAIAECGAVPVSVDIGQDANIDPDAIEAAITPKTKAIVPVHFTGLMCQMDKICEIARKHNLLIIEDAAQAYGARYKSKMAGSFSKVAAFSMNSMKVLASFGEAGAVTTDDPDIYETVRMMRYSGTKSDPRKIVTNEGYYVALNHKINTIQAAMLLVAMKYLPAKMARRLEIANRYTAGLSEFVTCPQIPPGDIHALYTYAIQADRRDELREYLNANEIETKIYHVPLASDAPVYANLKKSETPVARNIMNRFLSLPAHEKLTNDQIDFVIEKVIQFYKSGK